MLSAGVMQDDQVLLDFHQMPDEGRATDIGIGLGSHDIGAAEHAADLYQKGRLPVVVFTGANAIESIADPDRVLNMLVGDTQRLWVYAEAGFAVPVQVSAVVRAAYDRLVAAGFTRRLVAP